MKMSKNYRLKSDQIWFTGSIDINSGSIHNIAFATSGNDAVPLDQINSLISSSSPSTSSWSQNSVSASFAATASYVINMPATSSWAFNAVTASQVEFNNIKNKPTLLSGSAQIASDISGAFNGVSASLSTRITNDEVKISNLTNNTSSYVLNNLNDNETQNIHGTLKLTGDIIAENFIISSSVTYMTTSFSSGSTIFGNNLSNTHQFTGSVLITGSIIVNGDTISDGVKYIIPYGTVYNILPGKEITWYGDVEVSGTIINEGRLTIINGDAKLGPDGIISMLAGTLELTSYYSTHATDTKFVPKQGTTIITGSFGISGSENFYSMNSPDGFFHTVQMDDYSNLIIN
jgi:hypothetical protein